MPDAVDSPPSTQPEVGRPEGRPGCAVAAAVAVGFSLLGAAYFSGRHAACAETAGSEAGFWCMPEVIGLVLSILVATAASAILAAYVASRVLGSSTRARRVAPTLLGVAILAIGLALLGSMAPRSGPRTPTGLWAPATSAETALADRLLTAWTQRAAVEVNDLYAEDARLIPMPLSHDAGLAANLGWDAPPWVDRDGIRVAVSTVNTAYDRVGPVTVTREPVQGLAPLPEGGRYVHWVTRVGGKVGGTWFDTVVVLTDDGRIHDHYVDEYYSLELRQEFGFRLFERAIGSPLPS